jgi:hypothetical protein
MSRKLLYGIQVLAVVAAIGSLQQAHAAPPKPEQLMPANTSEFVAVSDLSRLEQGWKQTQYAQMIADASLQPFISSLVPQVKSSNHLVSTIGISWNAVLASCSGDLGWGLVPISGKQVAHVLTLDLANRGEQAKVLFAEIEKALRSQNATFEGRKIEDMTVVVAQLPGKGQIIYGLKETVVVVTDDMQTLQGILARWAGRATDSLANHKPYSWVMEKSQPKQGQAHVARWFFDIMARVETQMIFDPSLRKAKGDNFLEVLRKQGFDAVKGAGGTASFSEAGVDIIVRAAAYAPGQYRGSMRMAKFLNTTPLTPSLWVPDDVFSCVTLDIDLANAFDSFGTLFGRLADEPESFFDEIMESFWKDPNGPGVNVRKELFEQLQDRITIINDAVQPVTTKSERFLAGIPLKTPSAKQIIDLALRKFFETDKLFKKVVINGNVFWHYQEKVRKEGKNQPRVSVPSTVFGVANGHFFIATHMELLEKVLNHGEKGGMAKAKDYNIAMQKLVEVGAGVACNRSYVRVGQSARNTYEMLRMNKLNEAESVYAWVLTKVLKTDATGQKLRVNGPLLPEYGNMAPYLNDVAASAFAEGDGWSAIAVVLKK